MKRSPAWVSTLLLATSATSAFADPHQVMVLKSDGGADAATHARVDAAVLRLAKQGGVTVSPGELTYTDAAAAVGCKPDTASCRDDVMSTLSVDEIVTVTASVTGGQLDVTVRRVAKGAPAREATAHVAVGDHGDAKLDAAIGPLFGVTPIPVATPEPAPTPAPKPAPEPTPAPVPTAPPPSGADTGAVAPTEQPAQPGADQPLATHHTIELAGGIVAAAAVAVGVVMWGEAHSTQNQIDAAPTRTSQDFANLTNLENTGDREAAAGNFLVIAGLAVGAVSGYYWYRDHRRAQRTAMVTPVASDHGVGVALTIGGSL